MTRYALRSQKRWADKPSPARRLEKGWEIGCGWLRLVGRLAPRPQSGVQREWGPPAPQTVLAE